MGYSTRVQPLRASLYGYLILKGTTIALPLLYISPYDRFFFWVVVLVVLAIEVWLVANFA
jgi:hypothetical protein